ncbi:hypothetical protein ERJ75_000118400 [Trypanosoma vivax]|nr:hypothetical protein ERJ75_000118400 [Trypanosoma vivax]
MQVLRDELSEASFKPEEKVHTHDGAPDKLEATSPEHLCGARSDMFPMPSKPGFLLQDVWNAVAAWARTVGEMGLAEGLKRIGTRAYNRRRPLRAKSVRPEGKRSHPVERRKALEERKARITKRGDRSAETTGACAEQRAMLSLRTSGASQFDVPCEDDP